MLAPVLVSLLVLGISGCGEDEEPRTANPSAPAEASEGPSGDASPEPSEEPLGADDRVVEHPGIASIRIPADWELTEVFEGTQLEFGPPRGPLMAFSTIPLIVGEKPMDEFEAQRVQVGGDRPGFRLMERRTVDGVEMVQTTDGDESLRFWELHAQHQDHHVILRFDVTEDRGEELGEQILSTLTWH